MMISLSAGFISHQKVREYLLAAEYVNLLNKYLGTVKYLNVVDYL